MFHQSSKQILLGIFVALLLITMPVYAVKSIKISNYGGAHQIWFEAEDFDERNPDSDQYYPVVDKAGAFGQAINRAGGSGGMIRWTFNISKAGGKGGIWYFWARLINPGNQSDYMLVEGDPGDAEIPTGPPFPGDDGTPPFVNSDDRIFEENVGTEPDNWAWGLSNHEEGHTKELQDGENTMYIFDRSGNNTVFWDVFMWTDSPDYVPTDEDYQNAKIFVPGPASNPSPADEATDVPRDVVLSWKPGEFAPPVNGHTVYFSESFDDVNAGIGGVTQSAASYAPPQRLDFSKTYYWRVDEVNGPPDYTVFEGSVWSFTTEPFAYPVAGTSITATASSQFNEKTRPENTINGSGLDADDLHSTEEADIWVSSMTGPQPTWIQYEFDRVYKLHQMWVWNFNQTIEPVVGFGFKDVTIQYSVDGATWTTLGTTHEFARAPGAAGYAHNTTVDLGGVQAKYFKLTANSNWGGIMPQYGLSEVRFLYIPVVAREPDPASGATDVTVDNVTLSWRVGREAATHNLYFGTDQQAVIDETISAVSIPAGSSYANYNTGQLELGQSYYWKVNEVNEAETPTIWQGDVWNFRAQEYLVVDDFEDYNDFEPDRIFDTWIDGWGVPANGSQVGSDVPPFAEQTIVHSGKQSMPFFYDNTGTAAYSEAERTFAAPQNWTKYGVQKLVLYFYGNAGNTGQLYVKVNGSKVVYDGDAADIAKPLWSQWSIDLASLGVNLQNVTNMSIGIDGNGASGTLYFDDIRLALSFPVTGAVGANILFVSSLEEGHMPGDSAIKAFFERLGHGVTYIDDDADEAATEAAAAAADLVYISESVGSGAIKNEITDIETPMIVVEPYAWDEMGLTTGVPEAINQVPISVNITIINAGHPLAAGYSGDVPVFTALSENELIPVGSTGGGAVVIARGSGNMQTDADVYFVYEKGAALASPPEDGSPQVAADIRIGFFAASPTAEELLSNEGYDLLSAAVNYALGMTQ